jgi:hypothetical protein
MAGASGAILITFKSAGSYLLYADVNAMGLF